jgi:hypothetical protein
VRPKGNSNYGPDFARATLFESIRRHFQVQDFARLAFRHHFNGTATDFAIRVETLLRHARVHKYLKRLAAKRAPDVFGNFHTQPSPAGGGFATPPRL